MGKRQRFASKSSPSYMHSTWTPGPAKDQAAHMASDSLLFSAHDAVFHQSKCNLPNSSQNVSTVLNPGSSELHF